MENISDCSSLINFITGPCHINNNYLYCYLIGKKFIINYDEIEYDIKIVEEEPIGNTIEINCEKYCILPSINSFYENNNQLDILLSCLQEIQKAQTMRLILVFEENFVKASKSSQFYNYCNEIIQTLGLTPNFTCGIHLVVTNSSQNFIDRLPAILNRFFQGEHNFLIEGIKNKSIQISSFDMPIHQDNIYSFSEDNRQSIIKKISNTDILSIKNHEFNLLSKSFELIENLKHGNKTSDVKFVSDILKDINFNSEVKIFKSDKFLIIDKDIELRGEKLLIDCPKVIVNTKKHERRLITIRGYDPIISLEKVELVINGENLILTVSNENEDQHFQNPLDKDFDENNNIIRLESICINSWCTENISYNNKFIDLIVKIKRNCRSIMVDDKWKIKKVDCNIHMKLHINECMRTKNAIVNNFKSLRRYKNVEEYLDATNKHERDKTILENYIVNLPSIFQIFMTQSLFRKISFENREIEDLRNIRKIFIMKYLKLMDDFDSSESIQKTEWNSNAYAISRSFIKKKFNFEGNIMHEASNLINELDNYLMQSSDEEEVYSFLKFYNALSITNDKYELFKYGITGDLSIYPNFKATIQAVKNNEIIISNEGISQGSAICTASLIILATGNIFKSIFIPKLFNYTLFLSGPAFFSIIVPTLIIGFNMTCTFLKSGYYKNVIKIEGKDIRFDLV
ncbi:hypothetical protein SteCoe_333 [Stentor coeruleus]|uniref:Uncharacterized protein n=1 Tax=Stentor coeruleus TaxID=5963 RepID=A0A1R2D4G0_9CILI|nr:hypothetical protein SteCoe_333 [Stentor coeruleus]